MARMVEMAFPRMVEAMVQNPFPHTLCQSIHLHQPHQITHQLPVDTLPIPVEAMSQLEVLAASPVMKVVLVLMVDLSIPGSLHQDIDLTNLHWLREDHCLEVHTSTIINKIKLGKE